MPDQFKELKRTLPESEKQPRHIVTRVAEMKARALSFQKTLYKGKGLTEKIRGDYRLYRGWSDVDKVKTDSRHTVRIIFSMVKSVMAELMGRPPDPRMRGRTEDYVHKAILANRYFKWQMDKNNNFRTWQDWTLIKVLHGTAIMRKDWDRKVYKSREKALFIDENLNPREKLIDWEEVVYEGWMDKIVFLENFFWDPHGTDMQTCGWVIEQDNKFNVRDLEHYFSEGIFQADHATLKQINEHTSGQFQYKDDPRDDYRDTSHLDQEQNGTYRVDRYVTDENIFYILDECILLNQDKEFQKNPYTIKHHHRKPYIHSQFWPMPGEFLGLGIADLAGSYQHYATTAMNLELDQMRSNLTRKFIIRNGSIRSTDDLYDEQNVAVIVDDMDGIREMQQSRSMGSGLKIKDDVRQDAQNDLGITDIMMGKRIGGSVSATEAMEVSAMSKKQLTVPHLTQIDALVESARMSCAFNQQFLEEDIITWEGIPTAVTPDMFDLGSIDVDIDPDSMSVDYDSLQQKKVEILAQALENHVQYGYVDLMALDRARVNAIGFRPEDFLHLPGEQPVMGQGNYAAQDQTLAQNLGMPPGGPAPGGGGGDITKALGTNGAMAIPSGGNMNAANPMGSDRSGNPRSALGEYGGGGLGQ